MSLADLGPIRLAPEDSAYEAPLREALVRELYDRGAASLIALVPILFLMKAILGPAWGQSAALPWVFDGLAVVLAARLIFSLRVRLNPGLYSPKRLALAFLAGAALISVGFAALNCLAWRHLGVGQIGLLVILHAGINSVALTSMGGPSLWAYLTYMGVDIASLLFLALRWGGIPGYDHLLVLLLALYALALPFMAYQNHRALAERILSGLKLQDQSLHDALTGLRNRRSLVDFMELESEKILRTWGPDSHQQQSLAILLLDLDHFKQVNDGHGHPAGDAVLKQLAALLSGTLRKGDLVVRWGGEEFVLVARGTDRGYALLLADRIREKVEAHAFELPGGAKLGRTCSIGYCLFPFSPRQPDLLGWEQALSLADACLYRAKSSGRNRAIGAFPGDRDWEGDPKAALESVERDLETAAHGGLIRLMGELR
jgi:diguanylate cyclase (GGDEF)-like protein